MALALLALALPALAVQSPGSSLLPAADVLPIYKNVAATIAARVDDLLARMTVEEKVAQMLNPVGQTDGPGSFSVNASWVVANYGTTGLGTLYHGVGGCPPAYPGLECVNWLQASIVNSSRLGIPISFIGETLVSGCGGATIFPQPVLQGSTFDASLLSAMGTSIARQARLCGIDRGLSPVLQVDTDSRFGRFEESFGEDPYLVSVLGVAVAMALQGGAQGPNEYVVDPAAHVSCEAKHALAYGQGGRDWYGVAISDRALYDIYARPWKHFIREAGGRGLMVAHPEVSGLPLHGNQAILTGVLRQWFGGGSNGTGSRMLIASDWGNVPGIVDHGTAQDRPHAAMAAAFAGLDNEMSPPPLALSSLVDSVNAGLINISYIDRAAGNNLAEKFATGLFDTINGNPGWYINVSAQVAGMDTPADRALAYTMATEGITLLKNEYLPSLGAPLLPLAGVGTTIKRIALLGPGAGCVAGERAPCLAEQMAGGHYTNYGVRIDTPVTAVGNVSGVTVDHVAGASINGYDYSQIPAAVAAAAAADLAILVVGDSIDINTGSCSEMSDTDDTDLPGTQLALLNATLATGTPLVVVLFNCRPVTFGAGPFSAFGANNALLARVHTLVVGWRSGETAGVALWDVLSGAVNPSGRLTQNWVRNVGALHGPASPYLQARGARDADYFTGEPCTPLFAFGEGLSYSNFSVTGVSMSPNPAVTTLQARDSFTISGSLRSAGPAGRVSLLVYFSQNAPTKWVRYGLQLMCFGKFAVPANSPGTPFAVTCRVWDMEAYEPSTKDYEVMTGSYSIQLGTSAVAPALASFKNVSVNGTYTWAWDYTK